MKIKENVKKILGIDISIDKIIYSSVGLKKHILSRKHNDVLIYFDSIEDIINSPDYVGINPNEKDLGLEYIKCYDDNVLVAVKIHKSKDKVYIASMYTISDYKLKGRVMSGRLKAVDKNDNY